LAYYSVQYIGTVTRQYSTPIVRIGKRANGHRDTGPLALSVLLLLHLNYVLYYPATIDSRLPLSTDHASTGTYNTVPHQRPPESRCPRACGVPLRTPQRIIHQCYRFGWERTVSGIVRWRPSSTAKYSVPPRRTPIALSSSSEGAAVLGPELAPTKE
jgi:hypothetical protein